MALSLCLTTAAGGPIIQPRSPEFHVRQIAEGVHVVSPTRPMGFGMDPNTVFIVGAEDVVVVDAHFSETATSQVIRAIKGATNKPVRYVINTHWHDDHVTGNAAYRREWPQARFIAHQTMRAAMLAEGATNRVTFLRSRPGTLRLLDGLVSKRQGLNGQPTDDEEIAAFREYGDLLRRFSAETTSYVRVPPDITFGDSLLIHQEDRRIVVRWLGRGHTAGDAIVHLPGERIVIAGDLVVRPVPFVGSTSFPREMGETLEKMLALGATVIIPGHGEPLREDGYVRDVIRMLKYIRAEADSGVARGDSLGAVTRRANLSEFRSRFAGTNRLRGEVFDYYVASSAIAKAFTDAREAREIIQPPPAAPPADRPGSHAAQGSSTQALPPLPAR